MTSGAVVGFSCSNTSLIWAPAQGKNPSQKLRSTTFSDSRDPVGENTTSNRSHAVMAARHSLERPQADFQIPEQPPGLEVGRDLARPSVDVFKVLVGKGGAVAGITMVAAD
jgi:hypothetical protein